MQIEWKHVLHDLGIKYLSDPPTIFMKIYSKGVLTCTRCSKEKKPTYGRKVHPSQFYIGDQNLLFYRWARQFNLRYGIISDLYGLVYDDDLIEEYDVHPSSLSPKDYFRLGNLIVEQMNSRFQNEIVFYNSSPIMASPYLKILSTISQIIPITFITMLPRKSSNIQGFDL